MLYTPTVNSHGEEDALFGGVIWRCSFADRDSDYPLFCRKVSTYFSRCIFLYHQAIFHRSLSFGVRWVCLDFQSNVPQNLSSQQNLPCYTDWSYIRSFLYEFTAAEKAESYRIRLLFSSFKNILHYIYHTYTLFQVTFGDSRSNRQRAMDLLVQTSQILLDSFSKLDVSDLLLIESYVSDLKPQKPCRRLAGVTSRLFSVTAGGGITFCYHTLQYCPHQDDGCEKCQKSHTDHMIQTKDFLLQTHRRN